MADFIDEIVNYLVAQGIATQQGLNIFRGFIPNDVTGTVFCVRPTGGLLPDIDLAIENPTFQIYLQSDTYDAGYTKMQQIKTALDKFRGRVLGTGTIFFFYIYAQQSIGYIGRDDKGRDTFSINFLCKTRG
jgi:hypothetical protein